MKEQSSASSEPFCSKHLQIPLLLSLKCFVSTSTGDIPGLKQCISKLNKAVFVFVSRTYRTSFNTSIKTLTLEGFIGSFKDSTEALMVELKSPCTNSPSNDFVSLRT